MQKQKEPLSARRLFQTTELDEARAIVAGKFCDHHLNIATNAKAFDACHHRADGHAASLNYIRYGADVRIEPGELGSFYLIQIPLAGQADIDNCSGRVQTRKGLGSVLNPHRHSKMRWHEGCAQLLLQIDASILNSEAERLLGHSLAGPVTFATAVDETVTATADWVRKLKICFGLAERQAVFSQNLNSTQLQVETELIAAFLRSQPSNVSDLIEAAPSQMSNMHVRRAVSFIRNNLQKQISVSDIADAAGTSARSLQLFFRAELGLSPMRYLRQQRMNLARHLIHHSVRDETLGDLAFLAGFTHFGRFSAAYREAYGEMPSETRERVLRTKA
ncbi:MAG: AraC family transcriptional regulator [Pseudomonadota bacterium]